MAGKYIDDAVVYSRAFYRR